MDEFDQGMDPKLRRYFKKIINSFVYGLLWLWIILSLGLFLQIVVPVDGLKWYNYAYYGFALVTLGFLIRYYYRIWKD